METLKEEGDRYPRHSWMFSDQRDVMAEILRSISDALNVLGPGILGNGIHRAKYSALT